MEAWKTEFYHSITGLEEVEQKYGIPEQKKFPMPDRKHVISAIKFFNYVAPKYEKQLAKAILARMKEYGMSFDDFGVGEDNRFKKYIPEKYLAHHGILGMKWGVRRYQNKDGSLTAEGKKHKALEEIYKNKDSFSKAADKARNVTTVKNADGSVLYKYEPFKDARVYEKFLKGYVSAGRKYVDSIKEYERKYSVDDLPEHIVLDGKELYDHVHRTRWGARIGDTFMDYYIPDKRVR